MIKVDYLIKHVEKKNKKVVLFVPGGPWISGKYWDDYIEKNNFLGIDIYRAILPNHERLYGTQNNLDTTFYLKYFDLILQQIGGYDSINIVAHSFGAYAFLYYLRDASIAMKSRIHTCVIVGMPISSKRNEAFMNKILALSNGCLAGDTNESFGKYFEKILPLYFFYKKSCSFFSYLAKTVFWEKNRNMGFSNLEFIKSNPNNGVIKFSIIVGEEDELIYSLKELEEYAQTFNFKLTKVPRAGHFVMLDNHEDFTKVLIENIS